MNRPLAIIDFIGRHLGAGIALGVALLAAGALITRCAAPPAARAADPALPVLIAPAPLRGEPIALRRDRQGCLWAVIDARAAPLPVYGADTRQACDRAAALPPLSPPTEQMP